VVSLGILVYLLSTCSHKPGWLLFFCTGASEYAVSVGNNEWFLTWSGDFLHQSACEQKEAGGADPSVATRKSPRIHQAATVHASTIGEGGQTGSSGEDVVMGEPTSASADGVGVGGQDVMAEPPLQPNQTNFAEFFPHPVELQERDEYAAFCLTVSNQDDPQSAFTFVDGEYQLREEYVPRILTGWYPSPGTVMNVSQAHAVVKAVAEHYPVKDANKTVQCLPGTKDPIMRSQALYYLCEKFPAILLLARPLLAYHAAFNGCATTFIGAPLDELRPDIEISASLIRVAACEECPGGQCAPGCRFAAVQGYIDNALELQAEYARRSDAFIKLPVDRDPYMGNPLRAVYGSRGEGQPSGQMLNYAQNMQIMSEARDKLCLHNRKTVDPEQQQFNGDVINLISAMLRTLDRLTRDTLRLSDDKTAYANYRVCKGMWSDSETSVCHAWGEPSVLFTQAQVDAKFSSRLATSTPTTTRSKRDDSKKRKAQADQEEAEEDDGGSPSAPQGSAVKRRKTAAKKTVGSRSARNKVKK
jgi:hypothetical protein